MAAPENGNANGTHSIPFSVSKPVPLILNGEEKVTSVTFDVTSPLTNKVCWKSSSASEEDALAAIAAAEKAFQTWKNTKPAQRRDIFLRAGELLGQKQAESKLYSQTETGAADSMYAFEYGAGRELCLSIAGLIASVQGSIPSTSDEGRGALLFREPYGVVLGIAPWNAPNVLGLRACVMPLAMGNTVVLKASEFSPATYYNFVKILHEAGLPPGCLNTIYHQPSDAAKITNLLISHPSIKKVNFTGSTNVGSIVASLCGKNLKPCLMELGGKAPSIVCEDADLQVASVQCALGAFLHAGQICMSTERIICHESIAEPFKEALRGAMEHIFGSGESPVLVNAPPVTKNKALLNDALSKGARTVYGDAAHEEASKTRMRPVIIENVTQEMDIYHTESFGPTVSIYTLPAANFEAAALKLANDTDYGLSSSIFTEDLRKGLRMAKGIETGAVHINGMSVHDEAALPHGGAKKSGFGRFNAREGLEEWVRTKVVTFKE